MLEQHGIRGERDIVNARYCGKALDQLRQIAPQQRFAAGEAQFIDAQLAATRTKRSISSNVRISRLSVYCASSSGMQ